MASPSVPLSELIKAKVTTLIQEQLQPVVHELAAQHQMLLSHTALLKHNHNVNDYQMTRLENLRNLEQSINYKMSSALGHDPWQHPNIGTNLREPVPADPRLIPQYPPLENATPAERAAESTALIAEAGMSARRLGVPLTIQDFPRDPAIHGGGEHEDPVHSSTPQFGVAAPRWREKEGLPPHDAPGCPEFYGVSAPPVGKGRKLYEKQARKLKAKAKAMRRGVDAATAERGSSSSSSARAKRGGVVDDPAAAGPSSSTIAQVTRADGTPRARARDSADTVALDMSTATPAPSSSGSAPAPTAPRTTRPEPPTTTTIPADSTATATAAATKKKKKSKDKGSSKTKSRSRADQQTEQAAVPTPLAPAPALTSRKRSRRALEPEDDVPNDDRSAAVPKASKRAHLQPRPKIKQEENEEAEPQQDKAQPERAPKRRKRAAAPSPSPTIGLGNGDGDDDGGDRSSQGPPRRSARVTRASATGVRAGAGVADTAAKGAAARKRSSSGKRSTRSS